jgi:hypothetical protein
MTDAVKRMEAMLDFVGESTRRAMLDAISEINDLRIALAAEHGSPSVAAEAVDAERERCARACETIDDNAFERWKAGESVPGGYLEGVSDGAAACAAAIRKGGKK